MVLTGGRPSKVKISKFRKDIDDLLIEGKSPKYISDWLKSRNESISQDTIRRYRDKDFNIAVNARRKIAEEESKERLDKASDKVVDDIHNIDDELSNIEVDTSRMTESQKGSYKLGLLNMKYKILGYDKSEININPVPILEDIFDEDIIEDALNDN